MAPEADGQANGEQVVDGKTASPEEALKKLGYEEKEEAPATAGVSSDFNFEAQDFEPMQKVMPDPTKIAGIWCIVEDIGDTELAIEVAGEPTPSNIKTFVLRHVKKPDLSERFDGFGTGAKVAWFQGVMERLGFNESFFKDAAASLKTENQPGNS